MIEHGGWPPWNGSANATPENTTVLVTRRPATTSFFTAPSPICEGTYWPYSYGTPTDRGRRTHAAYTSDNTNPQD